MTTLAVRRAATRHRARDTAIRAIGPKIDQWTAGALARLLGIVAGQSRDRAATTGAVMNELARQTAESAVVMEKALAEMVEWSYRSTAKQMVRSLPRRYWLRRIKRRVPPVVTSREKRGEIDRRLKMILDYQRILDGEVDWDEAAALIEWYEFPPPTQAWVRKVLTDTAANDGKSAMQRIKTIAARDLDEVRREIQRHFAAPADDEASTLDSLSRSLRKFYEPDQGLNYMARRIARTESIRIAEAGQREGYEKVADVMDGVQWFSARLPQSRDDHVARHEKIYWRQPDGRYVADDGEDLPPIPLAANCLCWSSPVWSEELTQGVPDADYGPAYKASLDRFGREIADLTGGAS